MATGTAFHDVQEMRTSILLFGLKLFAILFFTDLLYVIVVVLLSDLLPTDSFHRTDFLLLLIHIVKSAIQIALVFRLLFRWLYHKYHLDSSGRKLFEQKGFLHTEEKMFDLKNLRDIKIDQSVFGKLGGYGNIIISTYASGGYQETIVLKQVQNPQKNMVLFKGII